MLSLALYITVNVYDIVFCLKTYIIRARVYYYIDMLWILFKWSDKTVNYLLLLSSGTSLQCIGSMYKSIYLLFDV